MSSPCKPRWGTQRRPERPTRGDADVAVAELLGWEFFPWQVEATAVAGEYDPVTRLPCYRSVGIAVARQNGKTTVVCARIARQLISPRATVAYTAQDRGIARTKWSEHVDLLMSTPFAERVAHVDRTNHREMLVMANGSRYLPLTPSAGSNRRKANSGRSLSLDLAVIDEAHAHETTAIVGAINPAMAARPAAQIWLLSNAGDLDSGLWRHYTDLGRAHVDDPASTLCWIEYAADADADVLDPQAWVDANPSLDLPGGVTTSALADAALTLEPDVMRREHLNVWVDVAQMTGIDPVAWAACRDDDLAPLDDVALGLDFTPERDRGALVAAGRVDGRTPLDVLIAGSDLEDLVHRSAEIALRWSALVVIDRSGPAANAIPALERAGVTVHQVTGPELARACGDLHDSVLAGTTSHRGDYRLSDAVSAASKRRVSDTFVWQRRGGADISPLVAATLARWGIVACARLPMPAIF